jgi:hypothetical protein
MYYGKQYQNQSVNKKMWGLIKGESGQSEGRYEFIIIYDNGKRISDPSQVAKLFNTYFTKIAEWLQCNFIPGTLMYSNSNQKLCASIFFTH